MSDPVRVTIVANEIEADLVCSFLRNEGIRCAHRVTNVGAGAWDGVPNMGGPREVLVDPDDLEAARALLAESDPGELAT